MYFLHWAIHSRRRFVLPVFTILAFAAVVRAEVLDLLAKGYLYKEIAEKTGLTYATVHTHIRHIYEKLHVRSRGQAVAKHLGQAQALNGPEAPRSSAMVPRL